MPGYDQRITTSTNTPLSGRFSKSGKSVSSGGNNSSSAATQIQGRAQGVSFTQGQFVRGEVIDLRGHEIKIQLPDSHVLTGNIDDAVQLAIGEKATFRVTEANGSLVSLKLMTDPRAASTELTIDKALDAAGLPRSDRNVSVVRALLEEGLSVDKNTIQLMLRQSANLRGVSFHTLAILHKQGLPMNEVNARALTSYLNYEHRIMQLAERTAGEFADTLSSLVAGGNAAEAEILNSELLGMLFADSADSGTAAPLPPALDTLSAFLGLADVLPAEQPAHPEIPTADLPLSDSGLLTQEEALTLADALEQAGLSREESAAIANGSATLREAAMQILTLAEELLQAGRPAPDETVLPAGNAAGGLFETGTSQSPVPDAAAGDGEKTGNTTVLDNNPNVPAGTAEPGADGKEAGKALAAAQDEAGTLQGEGKAPHASPVTSLFRSLFQSAGSLFGAGSSAIKTAQTHAMPPATPLTAAWPEAAATLPPSLQTAEIYTLLGQFASLGLNRSELGAILPKAKRLELENLLKGKVPESALKQLEEGEITVEKLLSMLLDSEDEGGNSAGSSYLASDAYQQILKQMLKDRFSIKPETLTKKGGIADFYARLDKDLAFIEKLPSRSVDAPAFQDTAAGIRENIDFMKALNQIFPYVQLPLKLSGKNAHAELYVYTNRRAATSSSDAARVLLHLDMEHLGALDIHLTLADRLVTARFYLPDAASASLTTQNMSEFSAMLKHKGYTLDARVEKRDHLTNPVCDMLSPEAENASMKRYSFDIRA